MGGRENCVLILNSERKSTVVSHNPMISFWLPSLRRSYPKVRPHLFPRDVPLCLYPFLRMWIYFFNKSNACFNKYSSIYAGKCARRWKQRRSSRSLPCGEGNELYGVMLCPILELLYAWHRTEDYGRLPQGDDIWTGGCLEGEVEDSSERRKGTHKVTERKGVGTSPRKSMEGHIWAQMNREYCLEGSLGTKRTGHNYVRPQS